MGNRKSAQQLLKTQVIMHVKVELLAAMDFLARFGVVGNQVRSTKETPKQIAEMAKYNAAP